MLYPNFIKSGDKIGLPAPSNGTREPEWERYHTATLELEKNGYHLHHSTNKFTSKNFVSACAKDRAEEFMQMWESKDINALISIAGGEFMTEIMPFLDMERLKNAKEKWFMGFSDNTILCHILLTWFEVSSVYHYTFRYFAMKKWHKSVKYSFDFLTGKSLVFEGFKKYQSQKPENPKPDGGFLLDSSVRWQNSRGEKEICMTGRAVGGCIDVLLMFLGTPYDKTKEFLEKYKKDGFIWYLESYDLTVPENKRAMWQLKNAGWFSYVKGFVFGRPTVNETVEELTYEAAVMEIVEELNVPVIFDADIGHKGPIVPIVNGAVMTVQSKKGKGKVSFQLV